MTYATAFTSCAEHYAATLSRAEQSVSNVMGFCSQTSCSHALALG